MSEVMIENIEKYLVLIASQNGSDNNYSTHGTGFLVSIKDKAYVVTCRHVARSLENDIVKFVITNPKRSTNINALIISDPIYYNLEEPYVDMCLMKLCEYPASVLNANGINTINLDELNKVINVTTETELIAYGYPYDFVLKYMLENKPNVNMPISTISCTVTNWSLGQSSYNPINIENRDLYDSSSIVLTHTKNNILYSEGMSGGPVLQQTTRRLCGIIIGGGQITSNNNTTNILAITPISYLINMLNRLT
jgi:hypothetical protein